MSDHYKGTVFSKPHLMKLWHPDNGDPKTISAKSAETVKFLCPYCADRKVLTGYNDLATTHPVLIDFWCEQENILLGLNPHNISSRNHSTAWWKCNTCGRKYTAPISDMVLKQKRGLESCPYCDGRRQKNTHFMS